MDDAPEDVADRSVGVGIERDAFVRSVASPLETFEHVAVTRNHAFELTPDCAAPHQKVELLDVVS
jgi:hypothetical protein